jgi:hypothetical protein
MEEVYAASFLHSHFVWGTASTAGGLGVSCPVASIGSLGVRVHGVLDNSSCGLYHGIGFSNFELHLFDYLHCHEIGDILDSIRRFAA